MKKRLFTALAPLLLFGTSAQAANFAGGYACITREYFEQFIQSLVLHAQTDHVGNSTDHSTDDYSPKYFRHSSSIIHSIDWTVYSLFFRRI